MVSCTHVLYAIIFKGFHTVYSKVQKIDIAKVTHIDPTNKKHNYKLFCSEIQNCEFCVLLGAPEFRGFACQHQK